MDYFESYTLITFISDDDFKNKDFLNYSYLDIDSDEVNDNSIDEELNKHIY